MSLSDLHQDLDQYLAGDDPDFETDTVVVEDQDAANRMLRRLGALDRQVDAVAEIAAAERDRIAKWETDRVDQLARQRDWLATSLAGFHRAVLADDPKAKTISLPSGTLKARAQQPKWAVDPGEFLPWAREHAADLVRHVERYEPDLAAIKQLTLAPGELGELVAAVNADGEVVPGVGGVRRGPKFTAEPTS